MILLKNSTDCCLARSLDESLHTRQGPARQFLILARYASRTVYEEQLELLTGSIFWPPTFVAFLRAWTVHMKVELKLTAYERYLAVRALLGMGPVV
jgi:aarF domain-containing kinase